MEFPDFIFDSLGEADVREEIVAPLLRHLGYRSGTPNNVIREQHLTYPHSQLGRRKPTDPILRGKADYICVAGGVINWVIEAKAPSVALDEKEEAQAWSYASHPEIRAVYFVLTNGREFKLFRTDRGPQAGPLFACTYEKLQDKLSGIENTLSPDAIWRQFPKHEIDTGVPLGPGLRSLVRITGGQVRYTKVTPDNPSLRELIMTITDGSVERAANGTVEANLLSVVPFQSLQELNEQFGLHRMRLSSQSHELSIDEDHPTVFESITKTILPQGLEVLNLSNWSAFTIPLNVSAEVTTRASGHLAGSAFTGIFFAMIKYHELMTAVSLEGAFHIQLA